LYVLIQHAFLNQSLNISGSKPHAFLPVSIDGFYLCPLLLQVKNTFLSLEVSSLLVNSFHLQQFSAPIVFTITHSRKTLSWLFVPVLETKDENKDEK
jgi:hypothetical protein